MRTLSLLVLLACVGCGNDTLVVVQRLEPGDGDMGTTSRPQLDIVARLAADATNFNPGDLMRLLIDGVDRTDEVVIAGSYAVLRIDPAPPGSHFVELSRRTGPVIDTYTWNVVAFAGPTLASVTPASARTGTQVTIAGTGFTGGALRVFFGGVEGTVDASSATSITATVPAGAFPGLVWVLVGPDAAEGVVDFQPLDAIDVPVPAPTTMTLFAAFPGRAKVGSVIRVYGQLIDVFSQGVVAGTPTDRLIAAETVTLPAIGDVVTGLIVVNVGTTPGVGEIYMVNAGAQIESNRLPLTVEE